MLDELGMNTQLDPDWLWVPAELTLWLAPPLLEDWELTWECEYGLLEDGFPD